MRDKPIPDASTFDKKKRTDIYTSIFEKTSPKDPYQTGVDSYKHLEKRGQVVSPGSTRR